MTWEKKPAIIGQQQPCLHAGVAESVFPLDGLIAVGFGCAIVTCDGTCMLDGEESEQDITCTQAEELAVKDPEHDWRIILEGPLSGREYQRHGLNRWVLIHQNKGFA